MVNGNQHTRYLIAYTIYFTSYAMHERTHCINPYKSMWLMEIYKYVTEMLVNGCLHKQAWMVLLYALLGSRYTVCSYYSNSSVA